MKYKTEEYARYFIPVIDCSLGDFEEYKPYIERDAERLNKKGIGCVLMRAKNPIPSKAEKLIKKNMYYLMREKVGEETFLKGNYQKMTAEAKFRNFVNICFHPDTEIIKTWEITK